MSKRKLSTSTPINVDHLSAVVRGVESINPEKKVEFIGYEQLHEACGIFSSFFIDSTNKNATTTDGKDDVDDEPPKKKSKSHSRQSSTSSSKKTKSSSSNSDPDDSTTKSGTTKKRKQTTSIVDEPSKDEKKTNSADQTVVTKKQTKKTASKRTPTTTKAKSDNPSKKPDVEMTDVVDTGDTHAQQQLSDPSSRLQKIRFANALHGCGAVLTSMHFRRAHFNGPPCNFDQQLQQFPFCICGYRAFEDVKQWNETINTKGLSFVSTLMAEHFTQCAIFKKQTTPYNKDLQFFNQNPHKAIEIYELTFDTDEHLEPEEARVANLIKEKDGTLGCVGCWSLHASELDLYNHTIICKDFHKIIPNFAKAMLRHLYSRYYQLNEINMGTYLNDESCKKYRTTLDKDVYLLPFEPDEDDADNIQQEEKSLSNTTGTQNGQKNETPTVSNHQASQSNTNDDDEENDDNNDDDGNDDDENDKPLKKKSSSEPLDIKKQTQKKTEKDDDVEILLQKNSSKNSTLSSSPPASEPVVYKRPSVTTLPKQSNLLSQPLVPNSSSSLPRQSNLLSQPQPTVASPITSKATDNKPILKSANATNSNTPASHSTNGSLRQIIQSSDLVNNTPVKLIKFQNMPTKATGKPTQSILEDVDDSNEDFENE